MKTNILEYLEETAARIPESTAFYTDLAALTFSQLLSQAKALGSCLAQYLEPGNVVALVTDGHGLSCIPAMFGVLYAGCAFAPLDAAAPTQRLGLLLEQMKPQCILTDGRGEKALAALGGEQPWILSIGEGLIAPIDEALLAARRAGSRPEDGVSIFYTSGSTGIPKGSVQSHSSYIHYTEATIRVYGFDETVVFGSQSPFFYANSIIDIYPPIALGAKTYLLPSGCLAFPKQFLECMQREKVSELTMTPSSFLTLAPSLYDGCLPQLRYVISSGERMTWQTLSPWMKAAPQAGHYLFYGSTEAFSVAVGRVERSYTPGELLPVGPVFQEVELPFLDENGAPCGPHAGGEMLSSSPWICSGYFRDQPRTEAAFVNISGKRYFRTGDVGRINDRGELVVLGRRDSQIKHHGYRMELGEVEIALSTLPRWEDGCVIFDPMNDQLVCFWTGAISEKELRTGLRSALPRAMLPDRYIHMEAMPRTATTKLDRAALKKLLSDL